MKCHKREQDLEKALARLLADAENLDEREVMVVEKPHDPLAVVSPKASRLQPLIDACTASRLWQFYPGVLHHGAIGLEA